MDCDSAYIGIVDVVDRKVLHLQLFDQNLDSAFGVHSCRFYLDIRPIGERTTVTDDVRLPGPLRLLQHYCEFFCKRLACVRVLNVKFFRIMC
jgi:hypothetical protein